MAKTKIVGDAIVITSAHTPEELKLVQKYRPEAMTLYSIDEAGRKTAVFKVAVSEGDDMGSLGTYGGSYAKETHDVSQRATITLFVPAGVEDTHDYVLDTYGPALGSLRKIDDFVGDALIDIKEEREEISSTITFA